MLGPSPGIAAHHARWHTSTCTVTREDPDGEPTFDPNTGTYTDPADLTVYTGRCLVMPVGQDRVTQFGDGPVSLRQYQVTLTGLGTTIHVEDLVTVTDQADPNLDGVQLRVLDVRKASLPTNRRLMCEEVL